MKKSTLNVITLALVLINLVLTVILTFSLVSTNKKTNDLITKIAEIINLDVAGGQTTSAGASTNNIADIAYVDVMDGEETNIIVSYVDEQTKKTHQAVLTVSLGLNTKAKDYDTVNTAVTNGMKLIISKIRTEANNYSYSNISTNRGVMEANLLKQLQDLFQSEAITNVLISVVIQ